MTLFYDGYFTSLPDQFVEANHRHLSRWTADWSKNPYLVRSRIIDGVSIDLVGNLKKDNWPTLKCGSQRMLDLWMHNKGANYDGGYWGTLTENQRDPNRKSGQAGRDDTFTYYTSGQRAGKGSSIVWYSYPPEEKPKPPLKRDGIIAGEVIGHRCWCIEGGLLHSVYQRDVWKPGEVLEGRELGDWDSRGIHAWKDPASKYYHDYIRSYLNQADDWMMRSSFILFGFKEESKPRSLRPAMVTGTVFLWGDVVEHERGWRAEFARVRSLDWLYPDETMMGREQAELLRLRLMYGVAA